jgi:hypothetical protein
VTAWRGRTQTTVKTQSELESSRGTSPRPSGTQVSGGMTCPPTTVPFTLRASRT